MPRLRLPSLPADLACQKLVELVTDYLEGALSRRDRKRFERHLAGCPHCPEYLAQMRATIDLTGRITPDDLTPQMRQDFIELFRRWQADDE
ncbi:MAG TPA: zf-HC2 domain-containing protein [Streptosporangiaceae bacterium]|nr:zf-HC2 domain-containing protein [Streptosporangiaceae bacterium]